MANARSFKLIYALLITLLILTLSYDIWAWSIDRIDQLSIIPVGLIAFIAIVRCIQRHVETCPDHRTP